MAAHATKFVAKCLPKHNTQRAVTVTYTAMPSAPGGSKTTTTDVSALARHQADLSPETQGPFQQRVYWIPTADVSAPRRSDQIQQTSPAESAVWVVMDVRMARSGLTYCQCRIAQVSA